MIKKILSLALALFMSSSLLSADIEVLPGGQLFFLGHGAGSLGLAGNGITRFGSIEGVLYNPAVTGDFRRVTATLTGGGVLNQNFYGYTGVSIPTLFGVWSIGSTTMVNKQESGVTNAGTIIGVNASLAKAMTETLFFGIGTKFYGAKEQSLGTDFGFTADLGIYFKSFPNFANMGFDPRAETNNSDISYGIGLYDFAAGAVIRNIGKQVTYKSEDGSKSYNATEPLTFGVGASGKIVKLENFYVQTLVDLSFPIITKPEPRFMMNANLGLELGIIDMIFLRAGWPITASTGIGVPDVGPVSVGGGAKFKIPRKSGGNTDVKLDIAWFPQRFNNETNAGLFGTVSVGFGYKDDEKPAIKVQTTNVYFSPNFDGDKDVVRINLGIEDNKLLKGWKVVLKDKQGNLVKEFESGELLAKKLTPKTFVKRLVTKDKDVSVPEYVEWDGIGYNGEVSITTNIYYETVTNYVYVGTNGEAQTNAETNTAAESVETNTEAEEVGVETEENGEATTNTAENSPESATNSAAEETLETEESPAPSTNAEGVESGTSAPADEPTEEEATNANAWMKSLSSEQLAYFSVADGIYAYDSLRAKGRNDKKDDPNYKAEVVKVKRVEVVTNKVVTNLNDGKYVFEVLAWDKDDNTNTSGEKSVFLDKTPPTLKMYTYEEDERIFSPNGDGNKEEFVISNEYNMDIGDVAELEFKAEDGGTVKSYVFSNEIPKVLRWNGNKDDGSEAGEGSYSFSAFVYDKAGNFSKKELSGITLVRRMEKPELSLSADIFSPNKDGIHDSISINQDTDSEKYLTNWRLEISNDSGEIVNIFKGDDSLKRSIVFNGYSKDNKVLDDGLYSFRLKLFYKSGNEPESETVKTRIDNTAPVVSAGADEPMAFSPNDDGEKDTFEISNEIKNYDPDDKVRLRIYDDKGGLVYEQESHASNFVKSFVWEGNKNTGAPGEEAPSGEYNYRLFASDKVGNTNGFTLSGIKLDRGVKKASADHSIAVMSPNGDGENDKQNFTLSLSTNEGLTGWRFSIENSSGERVFEQSGEHEMPESISWNGKSSSGSKLDDGRYTYTLGVSYISGSKASSLKKSFIIDTSAPEIELSLDNKIFSPNGDGNKETFTVHHKHEPGLSSEKYFIDITDETGYIIKSITFNNDLPDKYEWNGANSDGEIVDNGEYSYHIRAVDEGGNENSTKITAELRNYDDKLSIVSSEELFSPGSGGVDTTTFTPSMSRTNGLMSWNIKIYEEDSPEDILYSQDSSNKTLPEPFVWDGKKGDEYLQDGRYIAEFHAEYENGNTPSAEGLALVDTGGPIIDLNIHPELFSPDNDGENDTMHFGLHVKDPVGIKSWKLVTAKMEKGKLVEKPFKTFTGTNEFNDVIKWDGYSDERPEGVEDDKYLVESATEYGVKVYAEDVLGNKSEMELKTYDVDILVIKTPDGYKIRINAIHFLPNRAWIRREYYPILDRLAQILSKYEKHTIRLEGHTDLGGNRANMERLSAKRANSVFRYLVRQGLDEDRFKVVGRGKSRPLFDEDPNSPFYQQQKAMNRRVEFYLEK